MIRYLQRRYALSRKGAVDNINGMFAVRCKTSPSCCRWGFCTGWWATSWAVR